MNVPEWFNIDDYRPSTNLQYWLNNIEKRYDFQNHLKERLSDKHLSDPENLQSLFFEAIKSDLKMRTTQDEPISLISSDDFDQIRYFFDSPEVTKFLANPDVNVEEVDEESEINSIVHNRPIHAVLANLLSGWESQTDESSFFGDGTLPIVASIDVNFDDEILINEFMKLVQFERDRRKIKVSKKSIDIQMAGWYTNGVLPHFDLVTWSVLTDQKVTQSSLGDLIWPTGGFDRAERIRKTTQKHFEEAFTLKTINSLKSQIEAKNRKEN